MATIAMETIKAERNFPKRIFFTDWEGPWVTTDFALEISEKLLNNQRFFERLSQYDDYLFYVKRKENYNAGDTLRLLAPFIAVYDITSSDLERLANKVVRYVPDAAKAMSILQEKFKPVVISTSYVQFLKATAEKIGVKGYLYGTEFNIERYSPIFSESERIEAEKLIEEISKMPEIRIDTQNKKIISGSETIGFLDRIFWEKSDSGFIRKVQEIIKDIKVIGGIRKLEIVKKLAKTNLIAIGDSISDFDMLGWVRERGLAISFNGNEYALMQSNIAIVSNSAFSEAAVVEAFLLLGFEGVKKLINFYTSNKEKIIEIIDERISNGLVNSETVFYLIDKGYQNYQNYQRILQESLKMRKILRGEAGKLG